MREGYFNKISMSSISEKVAINISTKSFICPTQFKYAYDESLKMLLSNNRFLVYDEFKKSLLIIAHYDTNIIIINKHTPKDIINICINNLSTAFGNKNLNDIRTLFCDKCINERCLSIPFYYESNGKYIGFGIINEHVLHNKLIVWEILWFTSLEENKGNGGTIWKQINTIASNRNIDAILVPSTNKAIGFWLKVDTEKFYLSDHIIRFDKIYVDETIKKICNEINISIENHIHINKNLIKYRKFYNNNSEKPYKWDTYGSTHIWYFRK